MRRCLGCGGQVTERFVRVFGPEAGDVRACIECSTRDEIAAGAAAGIAE